MVVRACALLGPREDIWVALDDSMDLSAIGVFRDKRAAQRAAAWPVWELWMNLLEELTEGEKLPKAPADMSLEAYNKPYLDGASAGCVRCADDL